MQMGEAATAAIPEKLSFLKAGVAAFSKEILEAVPLISAVDHRGAAVDRANAARESHWLRASARLEEEKKHILGLRASLQSTLALAQGAAERDSAAVLAGAASTPPSTQVQLPEALRLGLQRASLQGQQVLGALQALDRFVRREEEGRAQLSERVIALRPQGGDARSLIIGMR